MLKLLGSLLVLGGALWWGLSARAQLRGRARLLESLRRSVTYLAGELAFRQTPLPKLLEHLAEEEPGSAGAFFRDALSGLRRDPEGGLRQSWRQAMVRQLELLREDERETWMEVGRTLGRYDAKTQRQTLLQAADRLAFCHAQAEEEAARLSRMYLAVSLAAGAAVVLVLV